jgi:hypothetical protein
MNCWRLRDDSILSLMIMYLQNWSNKEVWILTKVGFLVGRGVGLFDGLCDGIG